MKIIKLRILVFFVAVVASFCLVLKTSNSSQLLSNSLNSIGFISSRDDGHTQVDKRSSRVAQFQQPVGIARFISELRA